MDGHMQKGSTVGVTEEQALLTVPRILKTLLRRLLELCHLLTAKNAAIKPVAALLLQ
jgi:hypothetical protein